ncbi:MAG TPA: hypothetical protein DF383_02115 [Deltaproteobacteria bacterium]|nr:hypothetical protein [Deltaproteobacteria bacterium]
MSDSKKNYHAVLGLESGASREELKKAFKELAFQFHPDRNPHNVLAEERFKQIVEAYSYLTGNFEALRALQRPPSSAARRSGDYAQDILQVLFDIDHPHDVQRKLPLEAELEISLEEAFRGTLRRFEVERQELCRECKGSGVEAGAKIFTCTYCFGAGEIGSPDLGETLRECPKCNGRGFLSAKACMACRAHGYLKVKASLQVEIPPRVQDGQTLTLEGAGHERSSGERGPLRITLHLRRHPGFSFDGKDIICEISVEMREAALGGEIKVPTLAGSTSLTLPPGTQSGAFFRLKGLGLGGDQFVKIRVKTPVVYSEKDRDLLRRMQESPTEAPRSFWLKFWNKMKRWFW